MSRKGIPKLTEFTSKIICGCCGKHYKRKIANGKHFWHCSTFLQLGKDFCSISKQVPEDILITFAEELGGMSRITEIQVPEPNKLIFVLENGKTVEREWQDRSRRESWTAEKREAARQKAFERSAKNGKSI